MEFIKHHIADYSNKTKSTFVSRVENLYKSKLIFTFFSEIKCSIFFYKQTYKVLALSRSSVLPRQTPPLSTCGHNCSATALTKPHYMLPKKNCSHWLADLAHTTHPGFIFPLRSFLHKAPLTAMWACVWSGPPPQTVVRKMRWRHKNLNGPRTIGHTPLSACSQQ